MALAAAAPRAPTPLESGAVRRPAAAGRARPRGAARTLAACCCAALLGPVAGFGAPRRLPSESGDAAAATTVGVGAEATTAQPQLASDTEQQHVDAPAADSEAEHAATEATTPLLPAPHPQQQVDVPSADGGAGGGGVADIAAEATTSQPQVPAGAPDAEGQQRDAPPNGGSDVDRARAATEATTLQPRAAEASGAESRPNSDAPPGIGALVVAEAPEQPSTLQPGGGHATAPPSTRPAQPAQVVFQALGAAAAGGASAQGLVSSPAAAPSSGSDSRGNVFIEYSPGDCHKAAMRWSCAARRAFFRFGEGEGARRAWHDLVEPVLADLPVRTLVPRERWPEVLVRLDADGLRSDDGPLSFRCLDDDGDLHMDWFEFDAGFSLCSNQRLAGDALQTVPASMWAGVGVFLLACLATTCYMRCCSARDANPTEHGKSRQLTRLANDGTVGDMAGFSEAGATMPLVAGEKMFAAPKWSFQLRRQCSNTCKSMTSCMGLGGGGGSPHQSDRHLRTVTWDESHVPEH